MCRGPALNQPNVQKTCPPNTGSALHHWCENGWANSEDEYAKPVAHRRGCSCKPPCLTEGPSLPAQISTADGGNPRYAILGGWCSWNFANFGTQSRQASLQDPQRPCHFGKPQESEKGGIHRKRISKEFLKLLAAGLCPFRHQKGNKALRQAMPQGRCRKPPRNPRGLTSNC